MKVSLMKGSKKMQSINVCKTWRGNEEYKTAEILEKRLTIDVIGRITTYKKNNSESRRLVDC